LNYTVNVASAGNYTAQLRVASPNGAMMHIGFNNASSVWSSVSVPATGGWQSWTTVSVPVVLGPGVQQMTVMFDTAGANLSYVDVAIGATAPPPPPPPPPVGGGTTVPVISWNIEINDNSESHARLAMDLLVQTGPQPQIIVIEEAYLTHFNDYIDELQRQTGKTWHGAWASHCASGDWNGSACGSTWYQGIGIFTTYGISDTSSTLFPYADCWTSARAGLRAALNVNGTILQVFATHLQTGGCANDMQLRNNSMRDLKAWAGNFSSPQIAAGDFNADPDQIDTTSGMLPRFVDTWGAVGTGSRFTAFGPNPSMKLDYWFADSGGRAVPQTSEVVYSTGGVSDHYPIQTTFLIK
jgi:endonuclease/exonuclease/phosphatase family metal-dependent hydrolase